MSNLKYNIIFTLYATQWTNKRIKIYILTAPTSRQPNIHGRHKAFHARSGI